MPVITYVAKREIESIAYAIASSAVSAAAADDSFNSATTDLSGLLDDQWILVAGFTNAANNGWFQANGNATTAKITQDSSTALIDEAAGPDVTIQGYARGFGQSYSIEFALLENERAFDVVRKTHRALGGTQQTLRQRLEKFFDIQTEWLASAARGQWIEFIHSVDGGESFTFDALGTIAVPVAPLACQLETASYSEKYFGKGAYYSYPLRLRRQP